VGEDGVRQGLSMECWGNRNSKSQISNNKWFDKLTTLSLVEGQITMTKIRNSKPVSCFGH
jgi:hypothetical protein